MQVFWNPQVVFVIAPTILSAPAGLLVARLVKAKSWLHIQDFEIDAAFSLNLLTPSGLLPRLLTTLERLLLRSFDIVSTISNRMVERLKNKEVDSSNIIFFPNWVNIDEIHPMVDGQNPFRKELDISKDDIVVLYAGNMGKKQGLEIVVETASKLQDHSNVYFVFCGEGEVRQSIEQQARGLPNVRFLPMQLSEKLNPLLNMADIHVLPQRENIADLVMPSKLLNMLASGKPVIAIARPDTEIGNVIEMTGILIPPEKINTLADVILLLSTDDNLRKRLGEKGRKFAVEHYEQNAILEKLQNQLLLMQSEI